MCTSCKKWRNKNKIFLHSPFTIYTFWLFISQELENNQGMTRKELVLERTSMSFVCWLGQQSSWPALRLKSLRNSSWEYQAWTPARNTGLSWLIRGWSWVSAVLRGTGPGCMGGGTLEHCMYWEKHDLGFGITLQEFRNHPLLRNVNLWKPLLYSLKRWRWQTCLYFCCIVQATGVVIDGHLVLL